MHRVVAVSAALSLVMILLGLAVQTAGSVGGGVYASSPPVPATRLFPPAPRINASYNVSYIQRIVGELAGLGSRAPGYPGYYAAADVIERELSGMGIGYVVDNYSVVMLVDEGSYLYVDGMRLRVYAMWPNGGVPPNGVVEGPLYYVPGLDEAGSVPLNGSIALVPLSIGYEWQWLLDPMIGVRAIVFVEDPSAAREDMYHTFLDTPVNIVRAYLPYSELARHNVSGYAALSGAHARLVVRSSMKPVEAVNIAGVIGSGDLTVILVAHYDSWSPAPAAAPGGSDALSPAILLDLARHLSSARIPGIRFILLFSGSHYEALAGTRFFVEKYFFEKKPLGAGNESIVLDPAKTLVIGIDIGDGYPLFAPVSLGYFYSAQALGITRGPLDVFREFVTGLFIDQMTRLRGIVGKSLGGGAADAFKELLLDSVDPSTWWALYPGPYWLDTEPFWSSGLAAFTFKTVFSPSPRQATPIDYGGGIDWDNVAAQALLLRAIVEQYIGGMEKSRLAEAIRGGVTEGAPTRVSLTDRNEMFAKLVGQVRLWNATEGRSVSLREAGLPPAIVVIGAGPRLRASSIWDARIYLVTDRDGFFEAVGIHGARAGSLRILAVVLGENGSVIAVNDMGRASRGGSVAIGKDVLGSRSAPWEVWVVRVEKPIIVPVVVEPQRFMRPVEGGEIGVRVIRSDTLADPDHYAVFLDEDGLLTIYVHRPRSYDLVFGPQPVAYVVRGVEPGDTRGLYDAAVDTLAVAGERLAELRKYHVSSPAAEEFLRRGLEAAGRARAAIRSGGNITLYRGYVLLALSLSSSAYQLSKSAYIDVENAATFFSILLVFFAIVVAIYVRRPGEPPFKMMAKTVAATAVPAALFYTIHPALRLTANAVMTVVGFVMIILVAPALLVLLGDFNEALREIRRRKIGVHRIERSKLAASYIAFSYGVEYMKKRRLRTILTLITLIIVVISVILFTSYTAYVAPQPGLQHVTATRSPGLLVEVVTIDKNLPLGREMRYALAAATNSTVVVREWAPVALNLYLGRNPARYRQIDGVLALEPVETRITNISGIIVEGRWLRSNDTYVVVIDKDTASMLSAGPGDYVVVAGLPLRVVGVYDADKLMAIKELDGEDLRPVKGYPRLKTAVTVIVPVSLAEKNPWLGKGVSFTVAQLSSASPPGKALEYAAELIYPVPAADIYASDNPGEAVYKYAQRTGYGGGGWAYVMAPLGIASISILGVMLGGLYERKKEIFIYAALGLSPTQIGLMFIAEALAYALIASVIGYSVGIALTSFLAYAMPGVFHPNYSSGYVVFALMATIAATVAASIYPIIKASKMALPSLRRRWEYPTRPEQDTWRIPLPFKITSRYELAGAMIYLHEYLSGFTSPDIGDFVVEEIALGRGETEKGERYVELAGTVRLKPWHAGIKQEFHVMAVEVGPDEWAFTILLKRLSGNPKMWVKANKPFIDAVRKQLLLWRTLHPEDKERYLERGRGSGII